MVAMTHLGPPIGVRKAGAHRMSFASFASAFTA